MPLPLSIRFMLAAYDLLWVPLIPLFSRHHRLREGYAERTLREPPGFKAELWIQAASVGEAFLALEIIRNLAPSAPLSVLLTTNTSQGREILRKGIGKAGGLPETIRARVAYIPFDKPSLMSKAVRAVNPKALVLLELELWPGLLMACRQNATEVMVINGRMKEKTLRRYLLWPGFWRALAPDRILAMSESNAARFAALFGRERVSLMDNIKFDRIVAHQPIPRERNPLAGVIPEAARFLVLGSVREEEEAGILNALKGLYAKRPDTVAGLFPRHAHRLAAWKKNLDGLGMKWLLRSAATRPAEPGSVILWDTFGELTTAYELAHAAFIGGSLAPLGGQNFLEPLISGVVPVSGPSWYNFDWVGEDIVAQDLLRIVNTPEELAAELMQMLEAPQDRETVRSRALDYVRSRQGGTRKACEAILATLQS